MVEEITEQVISPVVKLISQVIQVGAPAFPTGVSIDFQFQCTHSRYHRDELPAKGEEDYDVQYGPWKIEEVEKLKKYQIQLKSDELESMLGQWKDGIVDYETWLLDLKHKAALHSEVLKFEEKSNADFAEIKASYVSRQGNVWWKRIFMSRDPIRRLNASGRSN